jgi:hypothetical protein
MKFSLYCSVLGLALSLFSCEKQNGLTIQPNCALWPGVTVPAETQNANCNPSKGGTVTTCTSLDPGTLYDIANSALVGTCFVVDRTQMNACSYWVDGQHDETSYYEYGVFSNTGSIIVPVITNQGQAGAVNALVKAIQNHQCGF